MSEDRQRKASAGHAGTVWADFQAAELAIAPLKITQSNSYPKRSGQFPSRSPAFRPLTYTVLASHGHGNLNLLNLIDLHDDAAALLWTSKQHCATQRTEQLLPVPGPVGLANLGVLART